MKTGLFRISVLVLLLAIAIPTIAAAVKKYQVTGKVLEVNDKMILVEKGDEKWELERTEETKVTGKVAVGTKVEIHYHMIADTVEVKDSAAKSDKPEKPAK